MFGKNWNDPNEFFKRMTQILLTGLIIISLSAGIVYRGDISSAQNAKKDSNTEAHEALASVKDETSETEKIEAEAEAQTETEQIPETESETETESTEEDSTEAEPVLLVKKAAIPEDNMEAFINLLQLHPNYLANILSLRESWVTLETRLNETISEYAGDWSVYVKDLTGDNVISINEQAMESASLIKLYVMGAVMEQIHTGKLEKTSKVSTLLNDMITVSDNESTNELVRLLSDSRNHTEGMAVVNDFIKRHGFHNTEQINGLADRSLWSGNGVNTTSTQDCGKLLESIYHGNLVSHIASLEMESLLLGQKVTYKIPQALPENVISASKTGEVSGVENDTAIIYSQGGDFILCIMSGNWSGQKTAISNIHEITNIVYDYFNPKTEEN